MKRSIWMRLTRFYRMCLRQHNSRAQWLRGRGRARARSVWPKTLWATTTTIEWHPTTRQKLKQKNVQEKLNGSSMLAHNNFSCCYWYFMRKLLQRCPVLFGPGISPSLYLAFWRADTRFLSLWNCTNTRTIEICVPNVETRRRRMTLFPPLIEDSGRRATEYIHQRW